MSSFPDPNPGGLGMRLCEEDAPTIGCFGYNGCNDFTVSWEMKVPERRGCEGLCVCVCVCVCLRVFLNSCPLRRVAGNLSIAY